jgi:hypothetical protein
MRIGDIIEIGTRVPAWIPSRTHPITPAAPQPHRAPERSTPAPAKPEREKVPA